MIKTRIESSLGQDVQVSIVQTRIKAKIIIDTPGNLIKTSEFIEMFGNRFRQKKNKKTVELPEDGPELALVESEGLSAQAPGVVDMESNKLTLEELHEEGETVVETPEKKYHFDPDF